MIKIMKLPNMKNIITTFCIALSLSAFGQANVITYEDNINA